MARRMTAKTFIGDEIRRAKLAKPLIVSPSLVEAWERGRQGILPEHMRRLLGIQPDGTHTEPLLEFPPEFIVRMVENIHER